MTTYIVQCLHMENINWSDSWRYRPG